MHYASGAAGTVDFRLAAPGPCRVGEGTEGFQGARFLFKNDDFKHGSAGSSRGLDNAGEAGNGFRAPFGAVGQLKWGGV